MTCFVKTFARRQMCDEKLVAATRPVDNPKIVERRDEITRILHPSRHDHEKSVPAAPPPLRPATTYASIANLAVHLHYLRACMEATLPCPSRPGSALLKPSCMLRLRTPDTQPAGL